MMHDLGARAWAPLLLLAVVVTHADISVRGPGHWRMPDHQQLMGDHAAPLDERDTVAGAASGPFAELDTANVLPSNQATHIALELASAAFRALASRPTTPAHAPADEWRTAVALN